MAIVNQVIGSPLASGTIKQEQGTAGDVGLALLTQTYTINANTAGTVSFDTTALLPPSSQIHDITLDQVTAWDSVTSAALTIGSTSGGTQYAASFSLKGAPGRTRPTFTGPQLLSMSNIGTTATTVFMSVAQVGATTVGSIVVTIQYIQIAAPATF